MVSKTLSHLSRDDAGALGGTANLAVQGGNLPPCRAREDRPPFGARDTRSAAGRVARPNGPVAPSTRNSTEWFRLRLTARLLLSLALALLAVAQVHAADEAVLDRWFAAQAEIKTWSANLTQTRTLKALKDPLKAGGRVWFIAPNRFRWELGDPAQTIVVREADALVLLYPKLKRAERYPLGEAAAGQWRDALTLLEAGFPRSRIELEKQFKIVALLERDADAELVLQPRSSRARKLISEVRLVFGRENLEMRATELRFADGSRLRNDFTGGKLNPPLDETLFNAAVPAGFKLAEPLQRTAR